MSRTFNGSTDKGVINSALITSLGPFLISVWAKSNSATALQFAVGVGSTTDNDSVIAVGLDGATSGDPGYGFVRDDTPSGSAAMNTSNGYSTGTWHHLLLRNSSATARTITMDTNFAAAGFSSVNETTWAAANRTAVGVLQRAAENGFFSGKIARLTIWADATAANLPTAQHARNLYKGADPTLIRPGALVYHWSDDLAAVVGSQSFTFTGTATDGDNPPASAEAITASTVSSWEVPAGGVGSAGFTNTGLGHNAGAGELLIGDFTNSRIVRTDLGGSYIGEVILGGSPPASSVQGVAWDAGRGHYWVCHYAAPSSSGTIRRYDTSGALQQTITAANTGGPNGLAYDPVSDTLLTCWDDGTMREYSAAGSSINTINIEFAPGADGIAIDPNDSSILWISVDVAGAGDMIQRIDRTSGAVLWSLECGLDPESLVWIGEDLYACFDRNFHSSVANGNRVHLLDCEPTAIPPPPTLSGLTITPGVSTAGLQWTAA